MDKLERTNQWLTLATNVGVIAGLLMLIFEINQNTIALENQVDIEIFGQSPGGYIINDPSLIDLLVLANSDPWDSFSVHDQFRLGMLWGMAVDRAELQFRLRQRTGETLNAENIAFSESLLSQESFKTWWGLAQRNNYPSEFVSFFNSYMLERGN